MNHALASGSNGRLQSGTGQPQLVQGALLDVESAVGLHAGGAKGVPACQASTLGARNLLQADATRPHSLGPPEMGNI